MKFSAIVVYPVYVTVEADTQEEAEVKAFEQADRLFDSSTIEPVMQDIQESK